MELLKEIFNLNLVQNFIKICEKMSAVTSAPTINGIGVNFSEKEIESIKLYYGFHEPLLKSDIEKLHFFGKSGTFFKLEQTLSLNDYDFHEFYPQGVSFALKIDKNLKVSLGHFMMPKLLKNDVVFQLDEVKNYFNNNTASPFYNRKGIFTLINEKGTEHQKDYYYLSENELKQAIGKKFNVDTAIVPSIEWVLGKGFYSGSQPNDEKIVLQSNYHEVYHKIIKKETNTFIHQFNLKMHQEFDLHCVCPGYYKNNKVKSYYYITGKILYPNTIATISEFVKKLNKKV